MRFLILSVMLLMGCQSLWAQNHSQQFIDSIQRKYHRNGAVRHSYFSPEWQLYIDSALAITPENAYLWQQKSMPMFKQRKYELGMSFLDKAVVLKPKLYLDYRAFIKCIFSKQYRASLKDFEGALKLNEKGIIMDHPYKFYMGLCHLQLNEFTKARDLFLEVLRDDAKLNGSDSSGHTLRYFYAGISYLEIGEYSLAEKYFRLSIHNYSKFSDAKYYLSLVLSRQNKTELAKEYMRQAKENWFEGYTVSEDSRFYETYPYQIKKWFFK